MRRRPSAGDAFTQTQTLLIVLTFLRFFFRSLSWSKPQHQKMTEVEIGRSRLGRTRKNDRSRNWPKSTATVSVSVAMRRMCPVNNLMNTDEFMLDCRTSAARQHRYGHINHVVNVLKLENLDVFCHLVVSSPVTARGQRRRDTSQLPTVGRMLGAWRCIKAGTTTRLSM